MEARFILMIKTNELSRIGASKNERIHDVAFAKMVYLVVTYASPIRLQRYVFIPTFSFTTINQHRHYSI